MRVIAESLGDGASIGEQPQEPAPVTAGIEDPPAADVDVDRLEHRPPDEPVLVLHRLVSGRVLPIGLAHRAYPTAQG